MKHEPKTDNHLALFHVQHKVASKTPSQLNIMNKKTEASK